MIVSATAFLLSEEPLMKRCLSTGGAVLLFKPIPSAVAEYSYQQVIKALGFADKSPEERIEALLTLPVDELWQKVPLGVPLLPVIDPETFPGEPSFVSVSSESDDPSFPIPGRKWCESVMIGESALDVSNLVTFVHSSTDDWLGQHPRMDGLGCSEPRHCCEIYRLR